MSESERKARKVRNVLLFGSNIWPHNLSSIRFVLDRAFTGGIREKRALLESWRPYSFVPTLFLVIKAAYDYEGAAIFLSWTIEVRFLAIFSSVKRLVAWASLESKDQGLHQPSTLVDLGLPGAR